jgi:chromosome segregation ATPase
MRSKRPYLVLHKESSIFEVIRTKKDQLKSEILKCEELDQEFAMKLHSFEQELMNLFAQRNVYNERLGNMSRIQNSISERIAIEERISTHDRTIKSLQEQSTISSERLANVQKLYKELKSENETLEVEYEKITLELKLLDDMAGKSVEDQEKTSRNLKQKLAETSQTKARLETDVALFEQVGSEEF